MNDAEASKAQLESPSYRLPALDPEFILGDSTRGVRFLLEYQKAEDALRKAKIRSTIVVFGTARAQETASCELGRWYSIARAFGKLASERGGALDQGGERYNVIATGGGPGIMEAASRGARDVGAPSIGFNITLPREQLPNPYTTPELSFRFHYFAMRKMHLAMRASALVVFPGGFGTCDELFEILTLRQTSKMPEIPIVLAIRGYWNEVINFNAMVAKGVIDATDLSLFAHADTTEEIWEALIENGLQIRAL